MIYTLPELDNQKKLDFEWFPTRTQCFIYRNWGTIKAADMARVLKCTEAEVVAAATDMGLDPNVEVPKEWFTRGYITIIRNNWHLLSYEQLCELLGWDEDYLAFILKEDDFLDIKLGSFKPCTEELKLEPLTEEQKKRTERIKEITEGIYAKMPKSRVAPFDFFAKTNCECELVNSDDQHFKSKIIYSYCALYGDTFLDKKLIDLSFPDKMLEAYSKMGVTGVWTQGVLSKIAPFPYGNGDDKDYQKRAEGIKYLVDRLAKYGIKLYLYFNEPRAIPDAAFKGRESSKGQRESNGMTCMCVRTEEVQQYIKDAVSYVVKTAEGLGGIYTITASEYLTHCISHIREKNYHTINCPLCKNYTREGNSAFTNTLIFNGAREADPNIDFIAYGWQWGEVEASCRAVDEMPEDIAILNVSESRQTKDIAGVETKVIDYSISVEGPGEFSKKLWQHAVDKGHRAMAKVQVNNTWEVSSVPYIPVFDKIYRHIKGLIDTGNVSGLMLSWTLGGYPSPMLEMINIMSNAKDGVPTLEEIYEKIFRGADTKKLAKIFTQFSDAFDEYPFHVTCAYYGPQHSAPSNPLYRTPTGFNASMVGYPYDDIEKWRSKIFTEEIYVGQIRKMVEKWNIGMELFKEIDLDSHPYLSELYDVSRACAIYFGCMLNQCEFVQNREDLSSCKDIVTKELALAHEAIDLICQNATIGYESSNHYYYNMGNLMEKIVNCNYLLDKMD